MNSSTTRTLCFTLLAIWLGISDAAAEPNRQYGGFSPDADGRQAYLDYINSLEVMKVEASSELQNAVKSIPVESGVSITTEQEADLRDWLYDFLVAFSVSGSDSLAAAFYLREGINNPDMIERMKKDGYDAVFAFFRAQHRQVLDLKGRDHYFGNVSFFGSAYKVFEMQGKYESYRDYAQADSLLPTGSLWWTPTLKSKVEGNLSTGEQRLFADFMFVIEEPEEFADFEAGPVRAPFFVRLIYDSEQGMWCLVEIFTSNNAPALFLFGAT